MLFHPDCNLKYIKLSTSEDYWPSIPSLQRLNKNTFPSIHKVTNMPTTLSLNVPRFQARPYMLSYLKKAKHVHWILNKITQFVKTQSIHLNALIRNANYQVHRWRKTQKHKIKFILHIIHNYMVRTWCSHHIPSNAKTG